MVRLIGDFNTSVEKALSEIDEKWQSYNGLVICGTWPGDNEEELVKEAMEALKSAKCPILGICFGFQMIALSMGFKLKKIPQRKVGIHYTESPWGNTYESYWHDWAVENNEGKEIVALKSKVSYVAGVQFHPEYQSSKDDPHPVLKEFLEVCKNGNVA